MEGRLIDAAIDPALLERRAPAYAAAGEVELADEVRAFADDEAGEVQDRLRGLGYLE